MLKGITWFCCRVTSRNDKRENAVPVINNHVSSWHKVTCPRTFLNLRIVRSLAPYIGIHPKYSTSECAVTIYFRKWYIYLKTVVFVFPEKKNQTDKHSKGKLFILVIHLSFGGRWLIFIFACVCMQHRHMHTSLFNLRNWVIQMYKMPER